MAITDEDLANNSLIQSPLTGEQSLNALQKSHENQGRADLFIQNSVNLFDKYDINTKGYYDSTNSFVESVIISSSGLFPVVPSGIYQKGISGYITYYDIDGVFISGTSYSEQFTVPSTADIALCRIAFDAGVEDTLMIYQGDLLSEYIPFHKYDLSKNLEMYPDELLSVLANQTDAFIRESTNLFNPQELNQVGWINNGTTLLTNNLSGTVGSTRSTELMPCVEGLAYSRSPSADSSVVAYYDANKVFISQSSIGTSTTVTIPAGATFMMWTVDSAMIDSVMISQDTAPVSYVPYWYYKLSPSVKPPTVIGAPVDSRWIGATYNAIGDSITIGTVVAEADAYPALIANNKGIALVNNYGVSGRNLVDMADPITGYDATAGLVSVFGGNNDWEHDIPLGLATDTTIATFYGGLHVLCTNLLSTFPLASIFMMTMTPRSDAPTGLETNTNGDSFIAFVEAIRIVAERFSIPIIDLYKMSGMKEGYTTDGLHPSTTGHIRLSERIGAFVETI